MTNGQNDKWTKWQMDKMTNGQNDKWTKWQMDKMTNGQNDKWKKWQMDKMTNWQNDQLSKWLINKMTSWQNDIAPSFQWSPNSSIPRADPKKTFCGVDQLTIFSKLDHLIYRKILFCCSEMVLLSEKIHLPRVVRDWFRGANVINLFCPWFMDFCTKLECLLD
jgi:hypothetical protein